MSTRSAGRPPTLIALTPREDIVMSLPTGVEKVKFGESTPSIAESSGFSCTTPLPLSILTLNPMASITCEKAELRTRVAILVRTSLRVSRLNTSLAEQAISEGPVFRMMQRHRPVSTGAGNGKPIDGESTFGRDNGRSLENTSAPDGDTTVILTEASWVTSVPSLRFVYGSP
jgi:hypothetical protein